MLDGRMTYEENSRTQSDVALPERALSWVNRSVDYLQKCDYLPGWTPKRDFLPSDITARFQDEQDPAKL